MTHYASPGRDCLKDDDHTDKCQPGPWYGSRPSLDPDWSHEHHISRVISCAQCGKGFTVTCHQSRRKYCNELCYQAARRNKDRPRIRDYQRIRSRRIARNKQFEAGREERKRVSRLVAEERRKRAEKALNGLS